AVPRDVMRQAVGRPDPPMLRVIPGSDPRAPAAHTLRARRPRRRGGRCIDRDVGRAADERAAGASARSRLGPCTLAGPWWRPGGSPARGAGRHRPAPGKSDAERGLAGRAPGLSERYVQHLLMEAGTSFSDVMRRKRVERARRLLEQPGGPPRRIVDVAYAVGF